jgi:predicted Zn-dependent protease
MKYSAPKGHTNKKMNESVYAERRQVIDLIYRAKNLLRANGIEMPRIDVRITSTTPDTNACGVAQMNGKYIWIPETTLKKAWLYQVVLHELCHAIWGIDHDKKCKLMHPAVQTDLTDVQAEQIFLNYAKKY